MLYPLDQLEAFLRAFLGARRRRWRHACVAVERHRRWSDAMALAVPEQRERVIGEHERARIEDMPG